LSHETISKITDQVAEVVLIWQRRPLEALYPVIYLDALVVKVKDGAHVRNKAAHIAVGVDVDGIADTALIELEAFKASELGRHKPDTIATFENAWERSPRSWRSRRCCAG
jgi:putative transposase